MPRKIDLPPVPRRERKDAAAPVTAATLTWFLRRVVDLVALRALDVRPPGALRDADDELLDALVARLRAHEEGLHLGTHNGRALTARDWMVLDIVREIGASLRVRVADDEPPPKPSQRAAAREARETAFAAWLCDVFAGHGFPVEPEWAARVGAVVSADWVRAAQGPQGAAFEIVAAAFDDYPTTHHLGHVAKLASKIPPPRRGLALASRVGFLVRWLLLPKSPSDAARLGDLEHLLAGTGDLQAELREAFAAPARTADDRVGDGARRASIERLLEHHANDPGEQTIRKRLAEDAALRAEVVSLVRQLDGDQLRALRDRIGGGAS